MVSSSSVDVPTQIFEKNQPKQTNKKPQTLYAPVSENLAFNLTFGLHLPKNTQREKNQILHTRTLPINMWSSKIEGFTQGRTLSREQYFQAEE